VRVTHRAESGNTTLIFIPHRGQKGLKNALRDEKAAAASE